MNKKGFVLVETLVVVIFVLLIFTILYNSAVPLLGRYVELSYYNDLDTTYDLYYVKKLFVNDTNYQTIINDDYKVLNCTNGTLNNTDCTKVFKALNIENTDKLMYINLKTLNKDNFNNDNEIPDEIKDYLKFIDNNSKILLLEHDGYISYLELSKDSSTIIDVAKEKDKTCKSIWIDDMDTPDDTSDDVTYLSGSKNCIDFNYLWYSGKMWRIVAIYPDGRMKLITEDAITAIYWGSSVEYDGSYIYQWLNEDFKDTLINPDTILENATWNYSTDGNSTPVRPETVETQKTKEATVGLLNVYEYYNSYRCNGSSTCSGSTYSSGYLNIGYYWWLITPCSDSYVRYITHGGIAPNGDNLENNLGGRSPLTNGYGVRPSIILQSNISLSGSGIKTDPYKIVGNAYGSALVGIKLYERYSGEYVNFNNEKYRIVSTENNITKLTRNDILRNENSTTIPKTAITKNSAFQFGKYIDNHNDTYWDYYLNNIWYNSIDLTYKDMMVDGTYYLGLYDSYNTNYKATICNNSASVLKTKKTKLNDENSCTRYPTDPNADGYNINKIYIGKVGLPRVGEMFSAQLGGGTSVSSDMWLITPSYYSSVRSVINVGTLGSLQPTSVNYAARPSITLSSEVKILSGSGMENDPYEIGL